jgi:hypothetical protein
MQTVRKQYNYFENLEKKIKSALAIYLVLFVIGSIATILGIRNVIAFAQLHTTLFAATASVFVIFAFGSLLSVIGKIDWLGELHIRLDKQFFGFLERSNDTIFRTLISVLTPQERRHFQSLPSEKKGTIAQSIFSQLSDDNNYLFNKLMNSGIFQNWIWYWISIYGTFAFTLLTVSSFAAAWRELASFSKPLFTLVWILALTHLFVSIFIGKFLVNKTKKTVQAIVDVHQMDISNVLIARIHDEPESQKEEVLQSEESDV